MEKIKRYACGAGDGMFWDDKGHYVEYSDYLKLKQDLQDLLTCVKPVMQWVKEIELMEDNFKSNYALEEHGYKQAIQDVIELLNKKQIQ